MDISVPRRDEKKSRIATVTIRHASFDFPPSIEQVVIWIARLGGFLARRHDGFPGVKTLWRGLQRLHDIASSWKLLHSSENRSL